MRQVFLLLQARINTPQPAPTQSRDNMAREQSGSLPARRTLNDIALTNSTPLNRATMTSIRREGRITAETAMLIREN
jgi:hypothetical protein